MASIGSFGKKLDLNIRQGACFAFTVEVANPDLTPVDLTGASAAAKIRKAVADVAATVDFSVAITLPNIINLSLTAAQTAAIPAGAAPTDAASQYVWDMEITWPDGCIDSPLYGAVKVKSEVTR